MYAGEDFHQGALGGAVLPHQRMHLAALQIEVHINERGDSGERFGDAFGFENDAAAPVRSVIRDRSLAGARSCDGNCRIMHWSAVHLHAPDISTRTPRPPRSVSSFRISRANFYGF